MSRRAPMVLAAMLASGLVGGLAEAAWADCVDTPLTITFDAGTGMSHCYTEAGMTVCAFQVLAPEVVFLAALALGDNDGDTSPDLMNHDIESGTRVYSFSMGGAPFAVTGFNFVHFSGRHSFVSSKDDGFNDLEDLTSSQFVTPDPEKWSGITSFTWAAEGGDLGNPGAIIDNLGIVAQCCGNGVVDLGEQCEDGNTVDGDCCSATCQFEASGLPCAYDDFDLIFCTDDVCDGGGSCVHPPYPDCDLLPPCGPARPPGTPAFEHPKKAKQFQSSLVQAFVVCGEGGGNFPTTTTEGGIPACSAQTPNERAGDPTNGWRWDATAGKGDIKVTPICVGARDLGVKLRLAGVVDGTGAPANGQGVLVLMLRVTLNDPVGGDMTAVYVTGKVPVTLVDGKGRVEAAGSVVMGESGLLELPNGSSIEVRDMHVLDPNGTIFARPGLFLR